MACNLWYSYDGTEIINTQRTEQYAARAGLGWFVAAYGNTVLGYMLGDGHSYRSAQLDDAPWFDPDNPDSMDYLGFYPIDVAGIEDSTREATVTENTTAGGSAGRVRHGTRSVVFNGVHVALSDAGADYGQRWLKQALLGGPCSGNRVTDSSVGGDLCYLSSEPFYTLPSRPAVAAIFDGGDSEGSGPLVLDGGDSGSSPSFVVDGGDSGTEVRLLYHTELPFVVPAVPEDDPSDCLSLLLRTLRNVTVVTGPKVTMKRSMDDGGVIWGAQFTAVAGVPWEFGAEVGIVEGYLDPSVEDPWAEGITPGVIDFAGRIYTETACPDVTWQPLFDPLCPAMIPPPGPVDVRMGCFTLPTNWRRRQLVVPAEAIPLWDDVVPKLSVHVTEELRNLRLRFYSDPFETGNPDTDPCAYCGDILISYVPPNCTLVFDAAAETVHVEMPGGARRRADSLVFGTDGKPFDWPALTCGFQYIVTFDLPQTQPAPVIDLSLIPRAV